MSDPRTQLAVECKLVLLGNFQTCAGGTLDEFLMERYAAFNSHDGRRKYFRVSHAPWQQCRSSAVITNDALLHATFPWFAQATFAAANNSPGTRDVRMSWPQRINKTSTWSLVRTVPQGILRAANEPD